MKLLAIRFDDTPLEWRQLPPSVYYPAIAIVISWVLIRRNPKWVFTALAFTLVLDFFVVVDLFPTSGLLEILRRIYDNPFDRAVWFSALFPYVMIALFYFEAKKKPNQPPEPTR
jgi:hypothetical protein